jgi:signal transduction histidine kinase
MLLLQVTLKGDTSMQFVKSRSALLTSAALVGLLATTTLAQDQLGGAAEAKAMLEKAVAELKSNEAAALAKFNKGEGGFKDRDLYVFCFDMKARKMTAHINPALLGKSPEDIKEKDGSPVGEKVIAAVKEGTINTVSYNFPKPGGTDPVPKVTYVTRVGDQGCGVGYYK